MASYTSDELSVPTATATQVADAVDFPREIVMREDSPGYIRFAFTSGDAAGGALISTLAENNGVLRFTLPPCTEAWVHQGTGSNKVIHVLIAGR